MGISTDLGCSRTVDPDPLAAAQAQVSLWPFLELQIPSWHGPSVSVALKHHHDPR